METATAILKASAFLFFRCFSFSLTAFSLSTFAVIALLVQGAWAGAAVVSNAPPVPKPPVADAGTSAIAAPWRDPFWPVGYLPPPDLASPVLSTNTALTVTAPQTRWQAARKLLQIQGLTRGRSQSDSRPHYLAVVNGRMIEAGDRVSVDMDGVRYRWLVKAINAAGEVSLEQVDALAVTGGASGGK